MGKELPLRGRRIIVTRPVAQAETLVAPLEGLGAEVLVFPTIRIAPPSEPWRLVEACRRLKAYDWIVFTSPNGVERFMRTLEDAGGSVEALRGISVAAVGPVTGDALRAHGTDPDATPAEFIGEAIVEAMSARGDLAGQRVLLARAEEAREGLPRILVEAGARVEDVPAYRTVTDLGSTEGIRRALTGAAIDMVVFTSGSTARGFGEMAGDLVGGVEIASIGPITSAVVNDLGWTVAVEAEVYTADGLVRSIREHYAE